MVTSEKVTVTLVSHKSDAVGSMNSGTPGQSIGVTCAVSQVIVGAIVSCTTIVALHVDVFKQSSVAVQVLVTL